ARVRPFDAAKRLRKPVGLARKVAELDAALLVVQDLETMHPDAATAAGGLDAHTPEHGESLRDLGGRTPGDRLVGRARYGERGGPVVFHAGACVDDGSVERQRVVLVNPQRPGDGMVDDDVGRFLEGAQLGGDGEVVNVAQAERRLDGGAW